MYLQSCVVIVCINTILENVDAHKLMGIYINKNLKWNVHISYIYNKMMARMHRLKRLTFYLTYDMKKLFYNAYIMSVFDYCCPVWANVSNSELSKVKNIQKKAARIILKRSNGNSAVSLFNDLKWLSFDNRLNYHIGVMTYKIINGQTPKYMGNLISMSQNSSYNLRSSTNHNLAILKRPKTSYMYLQNTFGNSSRMVSF